MTNTELKDFTKTAADNAWDYIRLSDFIYNQVSCQMEADGVELSDEEFEKAEYAVFHYVRNGTDTAISLDETVKEGY